MPRRSLRFAPYALALAPLVASARVHAQPAAPAPEVAEAARRLFRDGVDAANAGRWDEAYGAFHRAIELRASPLLRFNLALAAQNSGHLVEAVDQYRLFLREDADPANAVRRQEAQTAIGAIEPVLARLVITLRGDDEPAEVLLDGRAIPLAMLGVQVPLDPGVHEVEAHGARGGTARQNVTLDEGAARTIALTLTAPPPPRAGAPPTATAGSAATPRVARPTTPPRRPAPAAPQSTIERVRRTIEERAAVADMFGRRRWQRNIVLGVFQGMGTPLGLAGINLRYTARPWFEVELQGGGGHPFGIGLGLALSARYPWSYRYGFGLSVGISTNFTQIRRGSDPCAAAPDALQVTPLWLLVAITHEWRVSNGLTYRLALGVRHLFNHAELRREALSQCALRTTIEPLDVLFAGPTVDHGLLPVLPWLSFELGYSI